MIGAKEFTRFELNMFKNLISSESMIKARKREKEEERNHMRN